MDKPQEPSEFRRHLGIVLGLAICVSRPWRLLCTRTGRRGPGWREVGSVNAGWGLLILFLFASFSPTGLLWPALGLAVLDQLWHRLRVSYEVHSYAMGESRFTAVAGEIKARVLESLVAVALGAWVREADFAASNWLVLAGIGNLLLVGFVHQRQHAIDQDLLDGRIEATARAARIQDRPY